jgi:hypothetical protein
MYRIYGVSCGCPKSLVYNNGNLSETHGQIFDFGKSALQLAYFLFRTLTISLLHSLDKRVVGHIGVFLDMLRTQVSGLVKIGLLYSRLSEIAAFMVSAEGLEPSTPLIKSQSILLVRLRL